MKYTFIKDNKNVTAEIDDKAIRSLIRQYGLTNREAIRICLYDMGYFSLDDVAEIREKMAQAEATGKKPRKARERKPDLVKRELIEKIFELIEAESDSATVLNPERLIAFSINSDNYEITLSKKRKPKA